MSGGARSALGHVLLLLGTSVAARTNWHDGSGEKCDLGAASSNVRNAAADPAGATLLGCPFKGSPAGMTNGNERADLFAASTSGSCYSLSWHGWNSIGPTGEIKFWHAQHTSFGYVTEPNHCSPCWRASSARAYRSR